MSEDLGHLLLSAYPDRLARAQGAGQFKLISGGQASVPETSVLASAEFMIAVELDAQASQARIFSAATISPSVIASHFPASQQWQDHAYWDDKLGRLIAEQTRLLKLGDYELVLERRAQNKGTAGLPKALVQQALVAALKARGSFRWSQEDLQRLAVCACCIKRWGSALTTRGPMCQNPRY